MGGGGGGEGVSEDRCPITSCCKCCLFFCYKSLCLLSFSIILVCVTVWSLIRVKAENNANKILLHHTTFVILKAMKMADLTNFKCG